MKDFSWKEFKPTLAFLAKFIGIYVAASLIYGLFIASYGTSPDPITHVVTIQCGWILTITGWPSYALDHITKATTLIVYNEHARIAVYEGCNGINVMIIFVAFLLAFGPYIRALRWFIPAGLLVIHLANLARIIFLFWVAVYFPNYLYFLHKYFFTAIIYVVVFLLWILWVRKYSLPRHAA